MNNKVFLFYLEHPVVLYDKVVKIHHQHNFSYVLSEEWHDYMFRPLSGHLMVIKTLKIKITITN